MLTQDAMQTQILNWQLAGSFSDLLQPSRLDAEQLAALSQPGIYLWVEHQSDQRFANYVGKKPVRVCCNAH